MEKKFQEMCKKNYDKPTIANDNANIICQKSI